LALEVILISGSMWFPMDFVGHYTTLLKLVFANTLHSKFWRPSQR